MVRVSGRQHRMPRPLLNSAGMVRWMQHGGAGGWAGCDTGITVPAAPVWLAWKCCHRAVGLVGEVWQWWQPQQQAEAEYAVSGGDGEEFSILRGRAAAVGLVVAGRMSRAA